jgi:TonB family protein
MVSHLLVSGAHAQQAPKALADDRARGIERYRQGDAEGAVEALRTAVSQRKEDGEAWYYLGLALKRQSASKESRKALEQAVRLRPGFAPARTALAYTLLLLNDTRKARREAERALKLNARDYEAYYVIGEARLRENAPKEAVEKADAAVQINPRFTYGFILKARALVMLLVQERAIANANGLPPDYSRFKEAADSLERAIGLMTQKEEAEAWREELEGLRLYSKLGDKSGSAPSVIEVKEGLKPTILHKEKAKYTEEARQAGVHGTVTLLAVFAADGQLKFIIPVKGLPGGLTAEAVKAARKIRFQPAMKDGQPVSVVAHLEYNFALY